jgi:phosphoglycerate dehydrogenase-like enzyme
MEPKMVFVLGDPAAPHLRLLRRLPKGTTVQIGTDEALMRDTAPGAEVLLCDLSYGQRLASVFDDLRALRWMHSVAAGVDHLLFPALVESEVVLTNGRGAYKRALAEFVLAAALHFAKDVPRLQRQQQAGAWVPYDMEELAGNTMGIVGYGEIGRATAALAKAFEMRVLALRRRPERAAADARVDEIVPPERLLDLMARSDYVVVAAPLTPETRGLIDAGALAAMKPSAVLINVGRGPVVVESALERVLVERRIRGAALDVFSSEPLPANHRFYGLDNLLLSPHTADHVAGWVEAALEVFLENFQRFSRDEPLLNVVDKRAGY